MTFSQQKNVRNALAFAAWSGKRVYVWGNAASGGNATLVASLIRNTTVLQVVASKASFAAITANGVVAWGSAIAIKGWQAFAAVPMKMLVATDHAFAGITSAGKAIAFGAPEYGGSIPSTLPLSSEVVGITAAKVGAFVAWKADGTAYTWGSKHAGTANSATNSTLHDVQAVYSTQGAFAALKTDGRVVTWGDYFYGGCGECEYQTGDVITRNTVIAPDGVSTNIANKLTNVAAVVGANMVFVGVKEDRSLVAWGFADYGGDARAVTNQLASQQFRHISHTLGAIAAVTVSGEVITWGSSKFGGNSTAVRLANITSISASNRAFAALTGSGGVVVWGDSKYGGSLTSSQSSSLAKGVATIVSTNNAFAALKSNGSVISWGDIYFGADSSAVKASLAANVTSIHANDAAFLAVKQDRTVVVWGNKNSISKPLVDKTTLQGVDLASLQFV